MAFCLKCGQEIPQGAKVCSACGTRVESRSFRGMTLEPINGSSGGDARHPEDASASDHQDEDGMRHARTAEDRIICTQCGHIARKPSWLREWLPWCLVVGLATLVVVFLSMLFVNTVDAPSSLGKMEGRFVGKLVAVICIMGVFVIRHVWSQPWKKCRNCRAEKSFVPVDSPEGRQFVEKFGIRPDQPAGLSTGANLLIALALVGGTVGLILLFAWWKLN